MDYQILVLDLDGTLTNSKKEITQPTLEALIEIQEAGKKVVLASGARHRALCRWPNSFIWKITEVISFLLTVAALQTAGQSRQSTTRFFLLIVFRESTKRSENTPARGLMS